MVEGAPVPRVGGHAVAVGDDAGGHQLVGDRRDRERDGAGPGAANDLARGMRSQRERGRERRKLVDRRRGMREDCGAEDQPRSDPPAATTGARGAERDECPPADPREQQRVRAAERRVRHREGRAGGQQDRDDRGGDAGELAREECNCRQRDQEEHERRRAQPDQAARPLQGEVHEPEMDRPAAALVHDDREDRAEAPARDPPRQLLVDIERRLVDRAHREQGADDERDRGGRPRGIDPAQQPRQRPQSTAPARGRTRRSPQRPRTWRARAAAASRSRGAAPCPPRRARRRSARRAGATRRRRSRRSSSPRACRRSRRHAGRRSACHATSRETRGSSRRRAAMSRRSARLRPGRTR